MYFQYGEAETAYLSARDERMAAVIAQAGHIEREVDTDLFSAVVHHIVGQQISTKAQATIWKRMRDEFSVVDAAAVLGAGVEKLQSFGMTFRKAEYITDFARKMRAENLTLRASDRGRTMSHPGAERPERRRCLDGRDDTALLYAAARRVQLRRPRHPAGAADGVPPPKNRPETV